MYYKDEFVRERYQSFEQLFISFSYLNHEYFKCLELQKFYNEYKTEDIGGEKSFSFNEQLVLYEIIDYFINSNRASLYDDVNLNTLSEKVKSTICNDAVEYKDLLKKIKSIENELELLFYNVTFSRLEEKKFGNHCGNNHFFIRTSDELKCICCGATTKDYNLTSEELDFLEKCADTQEQLIKNVTKDDLPLIKAILIPRLDYYYNMLYDSVYGEEKIEDEDELSCLELSIQRVDEIRDLNRWIKWAHALDAGTFNISFKSCPKYLSDDIGEKLLLDIEKDVEKINNSNSRFKDLMVEFCNMTRYEILILLGNNIIDLYNQAKDEDSQYALAKAYYNLSCEEYRKYSGYFPEDDKNRDAERYVCLTANPDINNKVLKMKKRCKKVD